MIAGIHRTAIFILVLGSLTGPQLFAAVPPPPEPAFSTTCIQIDQRVFRVEVAKTPAQQQRGLQFRRSLAANRGMIFPYAEPQRLTFWMKDCKIALDLLFFRHGKLVDYVDSAPPCNQPAEVCPLYRSKVPADAAVELKAGSRKKYGFQPGSTSLVPCSGQSLDF